MTRKASAVRDVLVTGAGGHIGAELSRVLQAALAEGKLRSLTLCDLRLSGTSPSQQTPGLHLVEGDLSKAAVLRAATAAHPDLVFHLAGVTSRQAEADPAASLRTNVLSSASLFETLGEQAKFARVIFASSIAVHGAPLPQCIDDHTPPAPSLTYGAHKQIVEILLNDYVRRKVLDGISIRLPGIVARPVAPNSPLSSFAGDLMHAIALGQPFTCPVGPDATVWLLSRKLCVENLLAVVHGNCNNSGQHTACHMPAQRVRMDALAQALSAEFPNASPGLVKWCPDDDLQAQFARWPELDAAFAEGIGMHHDGDLSSLIRNALK